MCSEHADDIRAIEEVSLPNYVQGWDEISREELLILSVQGS